MPLFKQGLWYVGNQSFPTEEQAVAYELNSSRQLPQVFGQLNNAPKVNAMPQYSGRGNVGMPAQPVTPQIPQPQQPQQSPLSLWDRMKKGAEGINGSDALMALGSGMLGMSQDPRLQQLGMAGFGQVSDRTKARKATEMNNRTIDMLRERGVSDQDLNILKTNPELLMAYAKEMLIPKDKKTEATTNMKEWEAAKAGGFNGTFQQWLDRNVKPEKPEDMNKTEADLRKEFNGLQPVKNFSEQAKAFGRIVQAAGDSTGAGDIAVVFSYMKVLDPTSVVREGEFATAESASGVPEQVRNLYNKVIKGERLPEVQRVQFVNMAKKLYEDSKAQYDAIRGNYYSYADRAGVKDPENIFPDYTWQGNMAESAPATKPADMDEETWKLLQQFFGV